MTIERPTCKRCEGYGWHAEHVRRGLVVAGGKTHHPSCPEVRGPSPAPPAAVSVAELVNACGSTRVLPNGAPCPGCQACAGGRAAR